MIAKNSERFVVSVKWQHEAKLMQRFIRGESGEMDAIVCVRDNIILYVSRYFDLFIQVNLSSKEIVQLA